MSFSTAPSERHCRIAGLIRLFLGLSLFCFVTPAPLFADGQSSTPEPLVSVEAQNEPLGEVLEKLSRETSFRFSIEEAWEDHPVNIAFQNLPLSDGLNRILANLNHAVLYESAEEIRIAIYGEREARSGSPFPRTYAPPDIPVREPRPALDAPSSPDEKGDSDTEASEDLRETSEESEPEKGE